MDDKTPLYVGFDLGTSNSAAAVFNGEELLVIRNSAGNSLTPSVVRIDSGSRVTVGQRAQQFLLRDAENTHREFKRLMGTTQMFQFSASGRDLLPEELSAEVLKAMRKDVQDMTGLLPDRAVISVPALFELPQTKATARAAELAGFTQVELIQEPVASALAAGWNNEEGGTWMVYDLGGGTFDVSLLETRDGLLKIVGHDGDNFLGGRDFDSAITDWLIEEIQEQRDVTVNRGNPEHKEVLLSLRRAAEMSKIELSRSEESVLYFDPPLMLDGEELNVDLVLTRAKLETLCAPLIARTIKVCLRLLESEGIAKSSLSRIVLVGGPSVMPLIRTEVETHLDTPLAQGHDPMTLVAQGAALFAATAGLIGRAQKTNEEEATAARKVWCQYPPVSSDLQPYVIGRFEETQEILPVTVQLSRISPPAWTGEAVDVDDEHSFVLTANLVARKPNRFRLIACGEDGQEIATTPAEITILQGLTIGDPPLARSVGVALADNSVYSYFSRGSALPSKRTYTHTTIESITKGNSESLLVIPIVQGEFPQANQCQLVGSLRISSSDIKRSIPSGTPISMAILIDRGGKLSATATIKYEDGETQVFENVAQIIMPQPECDSIQKNLREAGKRVALLQKEFFVKSDSTGVEKLSEAITSLTETETLSEALAGGDQDAGQRAVRLLMEVDAKLSELSAEAHWPELEFDAYNTLAWARGNCQDHGNAQEMEVLDRAGEALLRAVKEKDVAALTRQENLIHRVGVTCLRRDPRSWIASFQHCIARLEEMSDLPKANSLVIAGKKAEEDMDMDKLQSTVKELWRLLPVNVEERDRSHESGVQ